MEFVIWVLLALGVLAFYLTSYIAKNIFFSVIATIMLIIVSFFALSLGLQIQTGETSVVEDGIKTITYNYEEIEIGDTVLSEIIGVIGLLISIYFLSSYMMTLWRR